MHRGTLGSTASILAGLCILLISLALVPAHAAEAFSLARVAVYFSPNGGATETVVRELNTAKTQVLIQAYSFTSVSIAKALTEASKRGVKIIAVLDKSNETNKYSAATFLHNAGIQPLIDDKHAIAHSKVMVIDSATIITGSFNFTKAAEEKNAENLLVIKDASELVTAYEANIRLHAGHAHPYQRQAATESAGAAPVRVSGNGEVHGNKKSKIYHLPACPGYAGLNPASVVVFAHEAAAEQAGYRKAKNCP
jgi:phosphatidylserine/phosphatidylglycerophosphate/cardiolipin synthase-like enzyme